MKIKTVQFVKGVARWEGLPGDGRPEVAFVGRSNVGKSSLLNMLVGRRALARISRTPGKTQEFNYYLVNDRFYLVDLPGYGYAKTARTQRERWARLIGRYVTERPTLRTIFHLIDSRHTPTALDTEVMRLMHHATAPYVVLLTKADKLSGNTRNKSKAEVERVLAAQGLEAAVILTSAKDKRGRDAVWQWMKALGV